MTLTDQVHILIHRPWQFMNLIRDFELLLDGRPIARVKNGQTLAIELPCGEHEFVAKIDWCRSHPLHLSIRPDGEACLRLRCLVPWYAPLIPFALFAYIFTPGRYLAVEAV